MRKITLLLIILAIASPKSKVAFAEVSHIDKVLVETQRPKQVTFSIFGASLPSFQIYPLKQDTRFALDLPGVDLSKLPPPLVGEHILLKNVLFETRRGRHLQSPRAILVFRKAVQYEIKSDENALHFIFTYAGTDKKFKQQLTENHKRRHQEKILAHKTLKSQKYLKALQQEVAQMTKTLKILKDNFQAEERRQKKELERTQINHQEQLKEHQNLSIEISNKNILIQNLNRELQNLKAKRQKKKMEVVAEEETHKALQNAIARAQKESIGLKETHLIQTAQNQKLKETITGLEKQKRTLQNAQIQINAFLKQQQELVANEKEKKTNLKNDIVFLQSEQKRYDRLVQKHNEKKDHLNQLNDGIVTLKQNTEEERNKLLAIKESQNKAFSTLKALQNNISDLRTEKQEYQNQLRTLAQQKNEATTRLESFHQTQKTVKDLQSMKALLQQEIIQKQALHKKITDQIKVDDNDKMSTQKQKALELEAENERLQKQNTALKQLTGAQKREYEKQLAQNEQLHFEIKNDINAHKSSLKQHLVKIESAKDELSGLIAEKQTKRQEVDDLKSEYTKLVNTQKTEQEKIAVNNGRQIQSHRNALRELAHKKKELQKSIEQQKEQLQLFSLKNENAQKMWEEDSESRLTQEKQKIEALRLTQQKLKQQIAHDLQKQEKEYRDETLSQKKIQENAIKQLKQEKQALLKEILIHKKQKQELKEQAKNDVLQINQKHLNSQQERNDKIALLTNEKKSLDEQIEKHKQISKKNTIVIEKQNEEMQALQQRNTVLKKEKEKAFEKLARVKTQTSGIKKVKSQNTLTRPKKRAPTAQTETIPAIMNRYWQIPPEKIDRTKFGGDGEIKARETGRGVLNRLMVVRNKGNMGSKVGLRIDGGARFAITQQSPTSYLIKLFDTRAGNLKVRRILDASDINTTVLRLLPHVEEEQHHRISLRIELRKPTRIQTAQDGTLLWLRFDDT